MRRSDPDRLGPPCLGGLTSVYTTNDPARDCRVIDRSPPDEGSRADLSCPGVAEYSYLLRQTNGREAVTYGHADGPGMPTFGALNNAGLTVEWRMAQVGGRPVPVAAIQHFYLADADGGRSTQVLLVSKVGQPDDRAACMRGYVSAHDGAAANRRARRIVDGAATHDCTHDRTVVEPSAAKVPPR